MISDYVATLGLDLRGGFYPEAATRIGSRSHHTRLKCKIWARREKRITARHAVLQKSDISLSVRISRFHERGKTDWFQQSGNRSGA
jgi:hypothetical protein